MGDNLFDLTNELLFQQMQSSQQQDWALPPQQIYIPSEVNYLDDFLSTPFAPHSAASTPQPPQHQQYNQALQQHAPQNPSIDENGNPIKIRKRPGRKPNPQSPAIRKAQNRAAQRAFRERKERHLKDLEGTINGLRQQRAQMARELSACRDNLEAFRAENWYLKGVMLTLQFVCLQKHMSIPPHSPYLDEESLRKMAQSIPHAIDAYVTAYTKNNMAYKPNLGTENNFKVPAESSLSPSAFSMSNDNRSSFDSPELVRDFTPERSSRSEHEQPLFDEIKPEPSDDTDMLINPEPMDDEAVKQEQHLLEEDIQSTGRGVSTPKPAVNARNIEPSMSAVAAIQRIRLQLRVQKAFSDHAGQPELNIQPTILQLSIPHDPRIDLIPTSHMRDRMIIFRDQFDLDECFALLLRGAVCHGGDPTKAEAWELPAEFFKRYWFLTIDYDISRTNKWRRLQGLEDIGPTLQSKGSSQQPNIDTNTTVKARPKNFVERMCQEILRQH
ncbi:hypothetical protein INT43_008881 [Umbelopsis isabellina]|uniref:BZIP domain-containing protein n=1 Tax=Mortierella isabellina TaxID=91625 RepID=A0A8H7UIR3_MORIS|nr:hypothetical protein INT43_008881 [Umbelopsis isabellina]